MDSVAIHEVYVWPPLSFCVNFHAFASSASLSRNLSRQQRVQKVDVFVHLGFRVCFPDLDALLARTWIS